MKGQKKNREDGFTLLEVMITMAVVAMVLLAVSSSFIYGFNLLSRMKQTAIASQCIQEELELIRDMSFDEILNLGTSFTNPSGSLSLLNNSQGILNLQDTFGDDIKKLTISILWIYRGNAMRKDIAVYITREGINKK